MEIERRLRRQFSVCAYCRRPMKRYQNVVGCPATKATIEHLNRHGPFYWSMRLREGDLVVACARCNASRGRKRLVDWFGSPYCRRRNIGPLTVHARVRRYLRTAGAKR